MLQHVIQKLKASPFCEILRRLKAIYGVMDRRGRQILIIIQVIRVVNTLMGTIAFGGLAGFLIILSKPAMILDNRYIAMIYHGLGFESQPYFLVLLSGLLVLFVTLHQVFQVISGLVQIRLMQGMTRRCVVMMYRYFLAENYEDHIKRGAANVIGKNLMATEGVVTEETSKISSFVSAAVNICFILAVMYAVNAAALAVLVVVVIVLYYFFFAIYKKKIRLLGKETYKNRLKQMKLIGEGVAGAAEIKLMGKERDFTNEVDKTLVYSMQRQIRSSLINSIPQPTIRIAGMITLYIVSAYVFLGDSPESAFSTLALFAAGAFRLLPSMQAIFGILMSQEGTAYKYQTVMETLQKAKKHAAEHREDDERSSPIRVKDKIVFDDVTYSYPGVAEPVVNHLSFSLPANRIVALFGRSGVGKTTLIRLLSGLLSPQQGRVLVDGRSLQDGEDFKRRWQRSTGITFQKPFFMSATLAMNIAFEATEEKIDYERVRKAIDLAQLGDFVESLPNGLDTQVEEDANILSGGQRQRLAIARALYKDSSVLMLDEATNALDLVVEKKIIESLMKVSVGKMIIIIAHRPDTMRFADMVLVMKEDGSVAQGSYDELLEKDADFRALSGAPELLAG